MYRKQEEPPAAQRFGAWLQMRRYERHLTQQELADYAGVSQEYICYLEKSNIGMPKPELLDKILKALEASDEVRVACPVGTRMVLIPEVLTARQAADRVNVCPNVIYRAIERGELSACHFGPRMIRILAFDLEDWVLTFRKPRRFFQELQYNAAREAGMLKEAAHK